MPIRCLIDFIDPNAVNKGTINTINLIVDDENKSKVIIEKTEPNEYFDNIEELIVDDEIDEMNDNYLNDDTIKISQDIDTALDDSVPEQTSSPKIKLFSSQLFNIVANSHISTANVLNPLNILSFPKIRVYID